MKREIIKEANSMRRLMGLELIKESVPELEQLEEMDDYSDHQERDEFDGDESEVIGVDSDIEDQRELKEGEESLPTMKEMKKCVSEGMSKKAVCEKYGGCDQKKLKEMYDSCKSMNEDSEGEETYNYGEDEGADEHREDEMEDELEHDKEEMAPHDRIKAIEDHLEALKKDMGYDEDREDRDEEGTNFAESNELNESQLRKLRRRIKR
jgi:hypothetical protein